MDFRFTPEDEELRRQARDFVKREWHPKDLDIGATYYTYDVDNDEAEEMVWEFARKLAKTPWYTMHWPKEYGGKAAPLGTQMAYREEMAYQGAPLDLAGGFFATMLMLHGREWQKEFMLPMLASGEIVTLSQGMSEPGSGSDLASLQTRAVRDGDDWVITGQKMWNGQAAHPWTRWGYYLVRTDTTAPKHRGLTMFLIDMKSPGVTLRPVFDGLGKRRWSEVFLDGVRVPERHIVGELNRGWYAAMTNFSGERSSIDIPVRRLRDLEQFLDFCKETRIDGEWLLSDPRVRHRLADLRIQIEICKMINYRVASMQVRGEIPVKEASMSKIWGDELTQRFYRALASLLGSYGTVSVGDRRAVLGGYPAANGWLSGMNTIGGGTAEIQRNIVAQRGLGLPR